MLSRFAALSVSLTLKVPPFLKALHVGWSSIYDIPRGPHSQRHPEIYDGGHQFNHMRAHFGNFTADDYHYASQPSGAKAGQDWMKLW